MCGEYRRPGKPAHQGRPHRGRIGAIALALALFLTFEAAPARAQEVGNWNQDYDPYVAAIGLSMGLTSGTGLSRYQ